jgi:hypothetical protein
MTFKRKTKAAATTITPAITASADHKTASARQTSVVGYMKSLLSPLNVTLLVLVILSIAAPGGEDDDSKTNLRSGAKTPDAKAPNTAKDAAPAAPKFAGITGKVLDSDAIESVLNSGRTNIAFKKPAGQSSDYSSKTSATNAVDGNRGGDVVSHTSAANCNDWWQVDLQGVHSVEDVIIFNRDGPAVILDRLSDFFVEILTLNGEKWDTTGEYHSTGSAGLRAGYHFEPGAKGSVVRIRLNTCEVLHMNQVEVYGTPV